MSSIETLPKVQAASAVYDLIAAGIFAIPVLAAWHLRVNVGFLHAWTGAAGQLPAFEPLHLLFMNMFGWFAIVWSLLRIFWREQPALVLCDVALRLYFAALMVGYITLAGITQVLYAFVFSEMAWSAALIWVYLSRVGAPVPRAEVSGKACRHSLRSAS